MPVGVHSRPARITSAYKPNIWAFKSDKAPLPPPGESTPIGIILVANQAAVDSFPGLVIGDVYVIHPAVNLGTWTPGQQIRISGTQVADYNGLWRVRSTPLNTLTVIDAPADTVNVGGSLNGTLAKVYERYRVVVDVKFDTQDEAQRYYLDQDPDGYFRMDVRNQAQREFGRNDVFGIATDGMTLDIVTADDLITNKYSLTIGEAYNIPNSETGVNEYHVIFKDVAEPINNKDNIVVNSVQPYHHLNEWDGTVDLTWNDDLDGYTINQTDTGAAVKRLLTYFPGYLSTDSGPFAAQTVGTADTAFLAFISWSINPLTWGVRVSKTNANGTTSTTTTYYTVAGNSFIVPVGPANVVIGANVVHYDISITNEAGQEVSRRYRYNVDRTCHLSPVRVWALNKFGAIDTFRFIGYDKRGTGIARDFVTKPTMAVPIGAAGDYQRKAWRSTPERTHLTESETLPKPMLRWVVDEIIESSDIRTVVYGGMWTPIVNKTDEVDMGFRSGRISFEYAYGVDNMVQTR